MSKIFEARERLILFVIDNVIWLILAFFSIFFAVVVGSAFFNTRHLLFIIYSTIPLGFLVMGESIVLMSGNIDISIGQRTGFLAMFTGILIGEFPGGGGLWAPWMPWYIAIIILLALGIATGSLNGFLVGRLKLNPLLTTLGTYLVFRGLKKLVSLRTILHLPELYTFWGGGKVFGFPVAILIFLATLVLLGILLRRTLFGYHLLATGSDEEASWKAGINTTKVVFLAYSLSGLLSSVSALLYTGFINCCSSTLAEGSIFYAVAGSILGGVALRGGRGSVNGIAGGVVLLGIIDSGLTMMGIHPNELIAFTGAFVLFAIAINRTREHVRESILRRM